MIATAISGEAEGVDGWLDEMISLSVLVSGWLNSDKYVQVVLTNKFKRSKGWGCGGPDRMCKFVSVGRSR
jgi:hypothetical protein